jgi:hypothetical protein
VSKGHSGKENNYQKCRHVVAVHKGPSEAIGYEHLLRFNCPEKEPVVGEPMDEADEGDTCAQSYQELHDGIDLLGILGAGRNHYPGESQACGPLGEPSERSLKACEARYFT